MFDRKKDELPPLLYNVGDKIMGYHVSIGGQMLVGGEVVERKQSTSYLDENEYKVKLEHELCLGCEEGKDSTWWINEKEAKPFKQDVWNSAVRHWLEHGRLQRKGYLEYIRMRRVLRCEPDNMSDDELEKELCERHGRKKGDDNDTEKVSNIPIITSHVSGTAALLLEKRINDKGAMVENKKEG